MILNTLTPKNLVLFGILDTYDDYTIDKDNLMLTARDKIQSNIFHDWSKSYLNEMEYHHGM